MIRCPECHSRSRKASPYCNVCFYRFTTADHARAAFAQQRWKYRLGSVSIGLFAAVVHYLLRG